MREVVSSAAKAELGALSHNSKEACPHRPICLSRQQLAPTNFASVELLVFNVCFLDMEYTHPCLMDIVAPAWLLMSGCTPFDASTHHLIVQQSSTTMAYFNPQYCSGTSNTDPVSSSHLDLVVVPLCIGKTKR
jgi:hypothetical protein